MIDGRNFFDQPINSMNNTYENIWKIATGKSDDYTTGCFSMYLRNGSAIAVQLQAVRVSFSWSSFYECFGRIKTKLTQAGL